MVNKMLKSQKFSWMRNLINAKNVDGDRDLDQARSDNFIRIVKLPLDTDAELNSLDWEGSTVPHWTYANGHEDTMDTSVKSDAEFGVLDDKVCTLLQKALSEGLTVVKLNWHWLPVGRVCVSGVCGNAGIGSA